jgi:hypothetical protein
MFPQPFGLSLSKPGQGARPQQPFNRLRANAGIYGVTAQDDQSRYACLP